MQSPLDISISKKMAEQFFGSPTEAIGKTILYQNRKDIKITDVFDNFPCNRTEQFDFILQCKVFLENN